MRKEVLAVAATMVLLHATPAKAQLGDPVRLGIDAGRDAHIGAASSGPAHGTALLVTEGSRLSVHHQDAAGRWGRFALPRGTGTARFARVENGATLAAWDVGDTLYTRTLRRDGVFEPARAVLRGTPVWDLASDDAGTVVLASATFDGVFATARDPGGMYTAPQRLLSGEPESLTVSSMTVAWGTGFATRSPGTAFGAAQTGAAPASGPRLGPNVQRICERAWNGCGAPVHSPGPRARR